jgi:linoleoyl-CoA desaturase
MMTRAEELQALQKLRERVRAEGLDKPTPAIALGILMLHFTAMCGGFALFLWVETAALKLIAVAISCYGGLGVALTGHNASHYAVTESRLVDRALAYFCFTLVHGVSSTYWYDKHVRAHHSAPNAVGVDADIELLPFFAMHEADVAAANRWQRRLFAIQHWLFPICISLILPNLKIHGVRHLVAEFRVPKRRRRVAAWLDAACLCGHFAIFLVAPTLFWPMWQVIGLYVLREIINGYMLFSIAAPAHFPLEAQIIRMPESGPSPLAGQIYTTINFRAGPVLWLLTQGAEHQIEHHLLPGANPLRLASVQQLIEPFCAAHGLPYRTMGWGEAVMKSLTAMRCPRPVRLIEDLAVNGPKGPAAA